MSHYGQFYTSKKKEVLASDGMFKCDGRLSLASTIKEAKRQKKMMDKHFSHKDITYVRLYRGSVLNPKFYTDYIYLGD